jgi:hypothetical protein
VGRRSAYRLVSFTKGTCATMATKMKIAWVGSKVKTLKPTRHNMIDAGVIGTVVEHRGYDPDLFDESITVVFPHPTLKEYRCRFSMKGLGRRLETFVTQ